MKIIWTQKAEQSFHNIIDYLLYKWTAKEANTFIDLVVNTIEQIKANPKLFKVSQYDAISREALITIHTTMFYRQLSNTTIEIEFFWNNFQNPEKLDSILS